jgi:hypothetical protein
MTKTPKNGAVATPLNKKVGREEIASMDRRDRIVQKVEEIARRKAIEAVRPVIQEIRALLLNKFDLPNTSSTEGIIAMIQEKAVDRFVYNHTASLLEELSDHMTKGGL